MFGESPAGGVSVKMKKQKGFAVLSFSGDAIKPLARVEKRRKEEGRVQQRTPFGRQSYVFTVFGENPAGGVSGKMKNKTDF